MAKVIPFAPAHRARPAPHPAGVTGHGFLGTLFRRGPVTRREDLSAEIQRVLGLLSGRRPRPRDPMTD